MNDFGHVYVDCRPVAVVGADQRRARIDLGWRRSDALVTYHARNWESDYNAGFALWVDGKRRPPVVLGEVGKEGVPGPEHQTTFATTFLASGRRVADVGCQDAPDRLDIAGAGASKGAGAAPDVPDSGRPRYDPTPRLLVIAEWSRSHLPAVLAGFFVIACTVGAALVATPAEGPRWLGRYRPILAGAVIASITIVGLVVAPLWLLGVLGALLLLTAGFVTVSISPS